MVRSVSRPNGLLFACLLAILLAMPACGTLEIVPIEPEATLESPVTPAISTKRLERTPAIPLEEANEGEFVQAIAWYGTIHSIAGGEPVADYFKPWHLDIWPKFGPAVSIVGADAVINDEIDRLRDTDNKATLWGQLSCGQSTYGPCQLLVTRLSASDGGPSYAPDQIQGWEGTVGRLLVQPGSQDERLYFVLAGEIPVLYGIASANTDIQAELEGLKETGSTIRIWGEVQSKVQPVTGSVIDVERLEKLTLP
jgi:hypothetical protein